MVSLTAVSSLEKILPARKLPECGIDRLTVLDGEAGSLQFVFCYDSFGVFTYELLHDDDVTAELYFVKNVPVELPTFPNAYQDDGYISTEPGLFPNLLRPADRDWVQINDVCQSVWVRLRGKPGKHELRFVISNDAGEIAAEKTVTFEVLAAKLPEQEITFTQWFHADCIYSYYHCDVFSERHWELLEKFLRMAAENGINMILTPIFTPPLDTSVGGERPTVQLLEIVKTDSGYTFGFDRLRRWIRLCREVGIRCFEMPHFFTQWGACATPKIMASVNGSEQRIFGWDHAATDPEYADFLSRLLPQLIDVLREEGVAEQTYFHISDEPNESQTESYAAAHEIVDEMLKGFRMIDAISDIEFYKRGLVKIPVPPIDRIAPFLEVEPEERWCYYCCAEAQKVSNRFIAMHSSRNRSIGVQFFKYRVDGFLQWGYNFYYSQNSRMLIDPFTQNDAYGAFPAGDAFSVYPGDDGPWPTIGLFVFFEALQDVRALRLLESKIGCDETLRLIETALDGEITFDRCFTAEQLLVMREAVNRRISEVI